MSRVPYVLGLLRKGLAVPEGRIHVGSGHEQWTLGAALAEGGRVGVGRPRLQLVRAAQCPMCSHACRGVDCQPKCTPVLACYATCVLQTWDEEEGQCMPCRRRECAAAGRPLLASC